VAFVKFDGGEKEKVSEVVAGLSIIGTRSKKLSICFLFIAKVSKRTSLQHKQKF